MEASPEHSSAARKFLRGTGQVKTLLDEVADYEARDAIVFSSEFERVGRNEVRLRSFATERESQPEHWPLLAGEAIQNLRSALDHLVYAASGGEERTQFPIFDEAGEFAARSPSMLKGVPEVTKDAIERAQPYRVASKNPSAESLAVLRRLSNADKHRVLATVTTAVHGEAVGIGEGIEGHWEETATGRALGSGCHQVSVYLATGGGEVGADQLESMFDYEVLIEGMRMPILKGIVHRIYRILAEVESGEPLSPAAPYPL